MVSELSVELDQRWAESLIMTMCLTGVRGSRAVQERVALSAAWSLDSEVMHEGDIATVANQLFNRGAPDLGQVIKLTETWLQASSSE